MTDRPSPIPAPDIRVVDDIAFGQAINESGQMETLHLDVYLPAGDAEAPRPAIMWFHGGGFTFGNDKRQAYVPRFARAFAARGYVGVAPDYRLRANPHADWAGALGDAVADARMAWAWLRAHAADYGVDPRRIALAGGSAGGMTVVSLVHDPARPVEARKDGLFALIDLWGTPDPQSVALQKVNPHSPPAVIVHGTADALVPYQNSVYLGQALAQAGVEHVLLTLRDAPHTPLMHFEQIVATVAEFLSSALEAAGHQA